MTITIWISFSYKIKQNKSFRNNKILQNHNFNIPKFHILNITQYKRIMVIVDKSWKTQNFGKKTQELCKR